MNPPTVRISSSSSTRPKARIGIAAIGAVLVVQGCAGSAGGPGAETGLAPDRVWDGLRRPRPEPLPGAVRVAVSDLHLLGRGRWSEEGAAVSAGVGLQELVSAGLLRRRDVHFVERRRFARAAERERRGLPRPEGAPPVGRSPGAELVLTGTWVPAGPGGGLLDLRLVEERTGEVLEAWRTPTPATADLVSLARVATGGLVAALESRGRLPAWEDPLDGDDIDPAPRAYADAGIPAEAVRAFLQGIAAEDAYRWEGARRGYGRALRVGGEAFYEPEVALARTARLRAGGTLGASP
ncbi:MAG: hypothetical protein GWM92_17035 [Gemmatimonadetes bacterium]|nr:hypothetical protein [Gemmatimonadota bacterium]NIR80475.1 hypothetical protein [Gemmatimonadota bacterium]NIT89236.1 hypothetical protein [Gemmatimonadota bacterium]NIU33035.1 hypothetical protein [Gemmatimonadota bacterium]NIU37416.1 hypothetical protein [Gemmatimonadota bacterium]